MTIVTQKNFIKNPQLKNVHSKTNRLTFWWCICSFTTDRSIMCWIMSITIQWMIRTVLSSRSKRNSRITSICIQFWRIIVGNWQGRWGHVTHRRNDWLVGWKRIQRRMSTIIIKMIGLHGIRSSTIVFYALSVKRHRDIR